MKLSHNEKEVLKLLIDNGRVTNTEISNKLGITAQGVGKIRKYPGGGGDPRTRI